MEQNLIKAVCPDCGKVKNIIGWVKVVNKEAIPANLPEELCPECIEKKRVDQTMRVFQQIGLLPD